MTRWSARRPSPVRSGAAVRQDAELVPLRVSEYDPAHVALADVGVPGTQAEQAPDLLVLLSVGGGDIEVPPVLDDLALGNASECQRRRHWPAEGLVPTHQRRANRDGLVVLFLHLVAKDRAPEPGETTGIGPVDPKLSELASHPRTPSR